MTVFNLHINSKTRKPNIGPELTSIGYCTHNQSDNRKVTTSGTLLKWEFSAHTLQVSAEQDAIPESLFSSCYGKQF